ncbi:choline/ethanolamine kinase family protein [Deinococcus cellulosilyticus]|uniref:Choline kinase n=1 Tax=Deinococcus cellulosilyticus (strain DSM 18568 / NBRC 106333 / KACC 11606 / 5516J-15) TaxID=1223518 RepID=A0A511N855_DEIC1|nr:choline/ethanolamine kinase family protein [Deinococcus cellulosilyticus]GEM49015.1 choline kinase [Deinococcus cellulosilyticus NBRC 106333 = KACC 11606]
MSIQALLPEIEPHLARPFEIEPLDGGFTNQTYKITGLNRTLVLKQVGRQQNILGLDPQQEVLALQRASMAGIGPRVIHHSQQGNFLLMEFLQGSLIEAADLNRPEILRAIVGQVQAVHQMQGIARACSPYHLVERYLQGASELGIKIPHQMAGFLRRMEGIEKRRSRDHTFTRVYCHNDLYRFNIMQTPQGIRLLDWELSGVGDAFFDLATLSFSNRFSREQDENLIFLYFGCCTPDLMQALQDMKFMNMLREIGWALLHAGLEPEQVNHQMDYLSWAHTVVQRLQEGHLDL